MDTVLLHDVRQGQFVLQEIAKNSDLVICAVESALPSHSDPAFNEVNWLVESTYVEVHPLCDAESI